MKAVIHFANQPFSAVCYHVPPLQITKTKGICPYELPSLTQGPRHELFTGIQVMGAVAQNTRGDFRLLFPFSTSVAVHLFLDTSC